MLDCETSYTSEYKTHPVNCQCQPSTVLPCMIDSQHRSLTLCGNPANAYITTGFPSGVGCPACQTLLRARRGA